MLTTLTLLAALLSPPQPAPITTPAGAPAIAASRPTWAFSEMALPASIEPEWVGAAFAEFIDSERVDALMASVTPFSDAEVDAADPFDGGMASAEVAREKW